MLDWLREYDVLLWTLGTVSVLMFVGSLIAIPWLVIRIPTDYFVHRQHFTDRWQPRHPLLRIAFLMLKNLCGVVLIVAGIIMLFTPGQGILSILVGLMFLDFPGKYALEQRLALQPPVIGAMNWIRAKAKHPPLQTPEPRHTPDEG